MANCLVLGANGFLGSHLVDALLMSNHKVRAFDIWNENKTAYININRHNLEVVKGDFLNLVDLDHALDNIEYVFHFISTTNPATSSKEPVRDVETNLKMSVELLKCAANKKIKRIIFPSTSGAIYGRAAQRPFNENDLTEPISPYAIGKQAIESYLRYFKVNYGLDYLIFRISNPYGERQNLVGTQGVIPIFLNRIKHAEPITVFGDGDTVRDYIYVTDVTTMIAEVFDKMHDHEVYNIGSGKAVTLSEIIRIIRQITGKNFKITHKPMRPTDVQSVIIDVSRFVQEFKMSSKIDLEAGIRRTWQYVQDANRINGSS